LQRFLAALFAPFLFSFLTTLQHSGFRLSDTHDNPSPREAVVLQIIEAVCPTLSDKQWATATARQ
jgi:hypothetical protein